MKKITLKLSVCLVAYLCLQNAEAQTAYPYFADSNVKGDLSSVATSVVDPSSFTLNQAGDFTFEAAATAGTTVRITNGFSFYEYTPTTTGTVRFVKRESSVYVYEGIAYTGKTVKQSLSPTFPTIADADVTTDPANLLQNASFEILGSLVGGTNYNLGEPWITNYTVAASGGIRVATSTSYTWTNGEYGLFWRGRGNDYYFCQSVSGIKSGTAYQIKIQQIFGNNASAPFHVGLGSSPGGQEYGTVSVELGSGKNGLKTLSLITPTIPDGETVYFTLKNDPTGSGDPFCVIDWITLVEGVSAEQAGVLGVSTPAWYVEGTAYAPEINFNAAAGDVYDMNEYLTNPSFESNFSGWTNSGFVTQTDLAFFPIADGAKFIEKFDAEATSLNLSISQTVSGLPNGNYRLKVAALNVDYATDEPRPNTYIYAGLNKLDVGVLQDYSLDFTLVGGTVEIGLKAEDTPATWTAVDNFRLYYEGFDLDAIKAALQTQVDDAKANYQSKGMQQSVAAVLNGAIAAAETAAANSAATESELSEASSRLAAAIVAAIPSIKVYAELQAAIASANALKTELSYLPGVAAFETAIATAQGIYTTAAADEAGIDEAISNLRYAERLLRFSADAPFDASVVIVNNSFEGDYSEYAQPNGDRYIYQPEGWTATYSAAGTNDMTFVASTSDFMGTAAPAWDAYNGKAYFARMRDDKASAYIGLKQDIGTLPAGTYRLKFQAAAYHTVDGAGMPEGYVDLSGNITSVPVTVAAAQPVPYSEYTIDFTLDVAQPVVIGFKAVKGVGGQIFTAFDDFTLFCMTKSDTGNGIDTVNFYDEPVSVEYYNLQGIKTAYPAAGNIYIVKKIYSNGKISAEKLLFNIR